jgi:hypothetical protein
MVKYYVVVNNKEDCPDYFLGNTCRIYAEKQFDKASENPWEINIYSKIDVFDNLIDAQEWYFEMLL